LQIVDKLHWYVQNGDTVSADWYTST